MELLKGGDVHLKKKETQVDTRADLQLQKGNHLDLNLGPFCSPQKVRPRTNGRRLRKAVKDGAAFWWRLAPQLKLHGRGQLSGLQGGVDRGQLLKSDKSEFRSSSLCCLLSVLP